MPEITWLEKAKINLHKVTKEPSCYTPSQTNALLEVVAIALIANAEEQKRTADNLERINDKYLP